MAELEFKPKKSVALSGVVAGNTALCSVGRSGNDLHYRGYDILDLASKCEFEEVAHLLIHGKLPTTIELTAYKDKLKQLRDPSFYPTNGCCKDWGFNSRYLRTRSN
jgi:2-methylcitrate synthase